MTSAGLIRAKQRLSSSRFELEGLSWAEIRDLPIEELGPDMTFGKTFEALRKSWFRYKLEKKQGLSAPDLCLRILTLQKLLGLPLSDFSSDLDRFGSSQWANEELSSLEWY